MDVYARRRGFMLVELLVVIAIIGVLVSLLSPVVQQARETARRIQRSSHLKQIALSLHGYHDPHRSFPPGDALVNGKPDASTHVYLLPYLEAEGVYELFDLSELIHGGPNNATARSLAVAVFQCPFEVMPYVNEVDGAEYAGADYVQSLGTQGTLRASEASQELVGVFIRNTGARFADIVDGASHTAVFSEMKKGPGGSSYSTGSRFGNRNGYRIATWLTTNFADTPENLLAPLTECEISRKHRLELSRQHGSHVLHAYAHTQLRSS